MLIKGQSFTLIYVAWNTSTNGGQAADAGNHTLRAVGDGTEFTPSGTPVQVDATNLPGFYKLVLTGAEANYDLIDFGGVSSTANVVIGPKSFVTASGDAFARLGTPASASLAADVAAVKADTGVMAAVTSGLAVRATVAAGSTPGSIKLTAIGGYPLSTLDNAYLGRSLTVVASGGNTLGCAGTIAAYAASTATLTLSPAPAGITVGDTVEVL